VALALDAIYSGGALPAGPGEFTLRAFLNGRLDLTQAEAVGDMIAATSEEASKRALKQLQGGVRRAVEDLAQLVEKLAVYSELELDFAEEVVELIGLQEKLGIVEAAEVAAQRMLDGYRRARCLREGVKVAITGAPNVGKSSLFNALIGESRAIVHVLPGTTRDVVSGTAIIDGILFEFFDTAGVREAGGEVEEEGIRRGAEVAQRADAVIFVDARDCPTDWSPTTGLIAVRNKSDLPGAATTGRIETSAATGEGIETLKQALVRQVAGENAPSDRTVSRERHYLLVQRTVEALRRGKEALLRREPTEVIAEEWREALNALDEITGKRRLEGLLDTIFGGFCIGK